MFGINPFLNLVEIYCKETHTGETVLSAKMFNSWKDIKRLREGKDAGVLKLQRGVQYLSDNWPEAAEWPSDFPRPPQSAKDADNA